VISWPPARGHASGRQSASKLAAYAERHQQKNGCGFLSALGISAGNVMPVFGRAYRAKRQSVTAPSEPRAATARLGRLALPTAFRETAAATVLIKLRSAESLSNAEIVVTADKTTHYQPLTFGFGPIGLGRTSGPWSHRLSRALI